MTARILIADGKPTSCASLQVRLAAACYDVVMTQSGEQVRRSLREALPELLLLGPGLSEEQLAELCGIAQQERPELPILVLTNCVNQIAAMKTGATAIVDASVEDQMLMARIRCLLRDSTSGAALTFSMAEAPATFEAAIAGDIALVADTPDRALRWHQLLQNELPCNFSIFNPEEVLSAAAAGHNADLYVIAANIHENGDGLRLLSELRARAGSRDAAFIVAADLDSDNLASIALDLGAGEVLPLELGGQNNVEVAAFALRSQLTRKLRSDHRRAEAQRNLLWAMTDPLTGLFNRRYALPRLTEIVASSNNDHSSFATLVLDLDHFKAVNDSYGHAAGDAVLCDIARRLETIVADRGVTARHGGEEFLVILPDTDEAAAFRLAEEVRRAVGMRSTLLPRISGGGEVLVTVSIGISITPPESTIKNPKILAALALERADRALIDAKTRGRNRVSIAPQMKSN